MWTSLCYSDVAFLYRERGFAAGDLPYRDSALEYPVLTGVVMQVSAQAAKALEDWFGDEPDAAGALTESRWFYDVTAVLMALAALVTVAATAATVPRRPWDGMLVAASPLLLLSAFVNWDLLAAALVALAVLAWTRERPIAAGALIGLGAAAKLYPVLLLGPMLLAALRAPDRSAALREVVRAGAAAVLVWGVVNLPVAWQAPAGWRTFFTFNAERGADFGAVWYGIEAVTPELLPERIDSVVVVAAVALLALIVALALTAPAPPRVAQLAFLAVAAFVLVNKVWSPQYSLWLLPLAVLARPRVRDLAVWQAAEVVYFIAVWLHLAGLYDPERPIISEQGYALAIGVRVVALLWFAGVVVRDILRPEHDPVRPFVTPAAAR